MIDVFQGIYSKYSSADADDLKTDAGDYVAPNGLYPGAAPQGFSYPLITYSMPSGTTSRLMQSIARDEIKIQFSVWDEHPSPIRVLRIAKKLGTLYEGACIDVGDDTLVDMTKKFQKLLALEESRWHYVMQFDILTHT